MNQLGSVGEIERVIAQFRERCQREALIFHADALAAALGISYEQLTAYAAGVGTSKRVAALFNSALQECTAAVLNVALAADPKTHSFWMFYLRNRAGFADKGEPRDGKAPTVPPVVFVGEERV